MTIVGYSAFEDFSSLTQISIHLPVTKNQGWAFSDLSSLTQVLIPGSLNNIAKDAFPEN